MEVLASDNLLKSSGTWKRLLQLTNHPWEIEKLIGGALEVDPAIEDINDIARWIQVSLMSAYPVSLICDLTRGESFYTDNVFLYSEKNNTAESPVNFPVAWNRIKADVGLKICMIASTTKSSLDPNLEILSFSTLVVDEKRGVAHRIDPEKTAKPALDTLIAQQLKEVGCDCTYIAPEEECNGAGPKYREWDVFYLEDIKHSPENVHYKMWTFWLLHQRLWFADQEHEKVFAEFVEQFEAMNKEAVANLILNFYPDFTSLANFNGFGRVDYLEDFNTIKDLPGFNRLMDAWLSRVSYQEIPPVDVPYSQLMQVFSSAIQELKEEEGVYADIFEDYMGERWELPNPTKTYEYPTWEELVANNSPIVSGKVIIGTYPHEPYYGKEDELGNIIAYQCGWEYEISEHLRSKINNQYKEHLKEELQFEWYHVEIPNEDLPWDGSDNDLIKLELIKGLTEKPARYDMILSGLLVKAEPGCDFSSATSEFFVSAIYTGKDRFIDVPQENLDNVFQYFAQKSTESNPIRIIHTSNSAQATIGAQVKAWINYYGGHAINWDVHIPSIKEAVNYTDAHLYVGDIIQIMRMTKGVDVLNEVDLKIDESEYRINLKTNLLGMQYPDCYSARESAEEKQDKQVMLLAPLALTTT